MKTYLVLFIFFLIIAIIIARSRSSRLGIYFICFAWGGGLLWFSLQTILYRALIEIDGTIVEITERDQYYPKLTNMSFCKYLINTNDTGKDITYVAVGTDPSLPMDLTVGTRIEKEKWKIIYKVNGEIVKDFPLRDYIIIGCIGLLLVVAGLTYLGYHLYLRLSYGDEFFERGQ